MKHYISPEGRLAAFEEDGSQDAYIPEGYVPATDAQVQAIQNPPRPEIDPKVAIQAEINALEQEQLLPRITREFMLLQFVNVAMAQGVDPMTNAAYVKLKAFNDQITALRAQL